jgi:hypothetical protein
MKVKIVYPVYNDWEALNLLMTKTADIFEKKEVELSYLAVDDCSSIPFVASDFCDFDLKVLHLISNQGHQRAIAIGLSYLADHNNADLVVVMDSDGEDQPEHILDLIEKSKSLPDKIIFAQRKKRTESFAFKLFYLVYKFIFKFLTGHVITFGNYSLIPASKIKKLANVSEIWNNYPGGVIRSLILHGMSAISVFLDFTAVRILIFASAMVSCSVIGAGVAIYFKFVLHQATPGWASNLVMGFFIVFIQGFFIALFILFMVLSSRRYTSFIPYFGYNKYIDFVE